MTGKRGVTKTAHSGVCFGVSLALTLGENDEEPVKTFAGDVVVNGAEVKEIEGKVSGAWRD